MSEATPIRRRRTVRPERPIRARLYVERLEDRVVPSTNVLVNDPGADHTAFDTQSETTMVLGAGNRVIVAFNDSGSEVSGPSVTGYALSTNGGNSFRDQGAPPNPPPGGADPSLAYSTKTGTVFLATFVLDFNVVRQTEKINIYRSTDNGLTFQAPVNGAPGFGAGVDHHDKEWIAVDNYPGPGYGNVYMAWRDFSSNSLNNGILFTRSTDDGLTWAPAGGTHVRTPSATGPALHGTEGAYVTVGPDHSVYVFWWEFSKSGQLKMRKSTDQGVSFGDTAVVVAELKSNGGFGDLGLTDASGRSFDTNAFPQAAVNPVTGDIYVVYADRTKSSVDKADIFFTQSTDGGTHWSEPARVNDDATNNDQWQPALAMTPDGSHVGVFWYDRRLDPANNLIDRFGVIGSVSGHTVSFGPNFRITDVSFPPVFGQDPGFVNPAYMGDYDVAVADNSFFYTTWGDNRLGNAFHANQPDVRLAKIPVTGPLAALTAAGAVGDTSSAQILTPAARQPVLTEAMHRRAVAGTDTALQGSDIFIADLGGKTLGLASGHTLWLDANAAGWGWFVDPTPWDDSEFTTPGNQGEGNHMDLLTVLDHELGHLQGRDHDEGGVMSETLSAGVRRTPGAVALDQVFAAESTWADSTFAFDWSFALPHWKRHARQE
jgi:hypothetical protein